MPTPPVRNPQARRNAWAALALAPLAASAAWVVYSRLAIDHDRPLREALPGRRHELDTAAGRVSVYGDAAAAGTPLLLVHSVNAAASAYEVAPLYNHYRGSRPVYALDLPGFGFSERSDRLYTPRLMADAVHAVAQDVRRRHGGAAIDVIALSLSCEYVARAALERPQDFRSLGLISPTGFDRRLSGEGRAQSTKGGGVRRAILSTPVVGQALYDLVVTRPSMRFFLQKTWGSRRIDEGLLAYDYETAHQPGARHAVFSFLSGFLFADDISRVYALLDLPVWAARGTRGDFVDYSRLRDVAGKPNWSVDVFDAGAFLHFERLPAVARAYDRFLAALADRAA